MASRTGLMPAKVKTEGKTKVTSIVSARKPLLSSTASSSIKTGHLTNIKRKSENVKPLYSHKLEMASKKVAASVAPNVSKNAPPAGSKYISKPAKNNSNMRKSHPVVISVDRFLPKYTTPSRKSFAAGQRTPKSILKKEPGVPDTGKKSALAFECPGSHHVKFNNKATEQATMRAKLNAWLDAKGKTLSSSNHRHHACFNVESSGRKNREVLVDRTITQNLLERQMKVLNNEAVKKELFTSEDKSLAKSDKENMTQDMDLCCDNMADGSDSGANVVSEEDGELNTEQTNTMPLLAVDVMSTYEDTTKNIPEPEVYSSIQTMVEECLHLFNAGCPLESILTWFTEMETSIPTCLTFAIYYIYKAKVVAAFPQMVLDIFCEAVKNNAQPSELLAAEMKSTFSKWLTPAMNKSSKTEAGGEQKPSHNLRHDVTDSESCHSMDTVQSTVSTTSCSTPKQTTSARKPVATNGGSTIKYSISSVKHLVKQTNRNSTIDVVTPVRRSARVSSRPPSSATSLRREVNSVSDLSEAECQSMLFRVNLALTDK